MPGHGVTLVTADEQLAAEVRRLCAVADQPLTVLPTTDDRRVPARAVLVVDVDTAQVDRSLPPATGEVIVLTSSPDSVEAWRRAVDVGARCVLSLPRDTQQFVESLAIAAEPVGAPGPVVAVTGARGGVGTSTFAIALATATAPAGPVTLVDLDVDGGGLDLPVGLESATGLRWSDLADARGVIAAQALRDGLPRIGGIGVLSCERGSGDRISPPAVPAVLAAASRGAGCVIVDLPRRGEMAADVVGRCDALVVVVPAEVRGIAAAAELIRRIERVRDDLVVVLRATGARGVGAREMSATLGRPVAVSVRTDRRIPAAADRGDLLRVLSRSPVREAAQRLWSQLPDRAA